MKLSAISAILIAGAFLLLTTTINQATAEPKCECSGGDVACYQKFPVLLPLIPTQTLPALLSLMPIPDPKDCCCGKQCVMARSNNTIQMQGCISETKKTGCEYEKEAAVCYCDGNYCNPASSLLPASILVVMTTAVLCLIVWPTSNIH